MDRTAAERGHGLVFCHAQPQQAQRRAGSETSRGARGAVASGRWRGRLRAQHAHRRGGTAGAGIRRPGGTQSAIGLCVCLGVPQRQFEAGTSGVRRSDPGNERAGVAECGCGRGAALRAQRGDRQADRADAGLDDRHGAVPSRANRARAGSARADAGDDAVLPAGGASLGRR